MDELKEPWIAFNMNAILAGIIFAVVLSAASSYYSRSDAASAYLTVPPAKGRWKHR
jgi:hypothetical protein